MWFYLISPLFSKRTLWQREMCCWRVWNIPFWFGSTSPSKPQRSSTLSSTMWMGERYVSKTKYQQCMYIQKHYLYRTWSEMVIQKLYRYYFIIVLLFKCFIKQWLFDLFFFINLKRKKIVLLVSFDFVYMEQHVKTGLFISEKSPLWSNGSKPSLTS